MHSAFPIVENKSLTKSIVAYIHFRGVLSVVNNSPPLVIFVARNEGFHDLAGVQDVNFYTTSSSVEQARRRAYFRKLKTLKSECLSSW